MRGLVIVDRQPDVSGVAVWCTSRSPRLSMSVDNVNAIAADLAADDRATERVRSVTRDRAVLLTAGSVVDGLPIEGEPLHTGDVASLIDEIVERQEAILEALAEHNARTKKKLVPPQFAQPPDSSDYVPAEDSPVGRAFALAVFTRAVWSEWLRTDTERQKRLQWMPEHLREPSVPDFPVGFRARLYIQPLI